MRKISKFWDFLLLLIGFLLFIISCEKDESVSSVKDIDGNVYHTVTIGTQVWMVENLKTTKYNDGAEIPYVSFNNYPDWVGITTPAYSWYYNYSSDVLSFDFFYNWYTVETGKLAPIGWHVPTDEEWTTMENYLISKGYNYDGSTTGNKIAKALASDTGWDSTSVIGSVGNTDYPAYRNKSGFTALPGGYIHYFDGSFRYNGSVGIWWSYTESYNDFAYSRSLSWKGCGVSRQANNKNYGFSVRCIRDN
jgi:uncharacterized protein (TIGR02145 family)